MKKFISILLAAAMCAGSAAAVSAKDDGRVLKLTIGSPKMTVDGEEAAIDDEGTAPVVVNDRTLVPIRAIIEAMGGAVAWDGEAQKVTLDLGGSEVVLTIGSTAAYLNGGEHTLDTAPQIINSRTMLPIRFIAESFGFVVAWDGETQTVTIRQDPAAIEVGDIKVTAYDLASFISNVDAEHFNGVMDGIADRVAENLRYGEAAKAEGFTLSDEIKEQLRQSVDGLGALEEYRANRDTIYKILEDNQYTNQLLNRITEELTEPLEAEIREHFIDNYYRAKHILVEDEALAKDILEQAKSGADFDALIEKYNTDPGMESNPNGYVFTYNEMVKEFEDCVRSLEPGELGLCKTVYGWHIIQRLSLSGDEDDFETWLDICSSRASLEVMMDNVAKRINEVCEKNNIEVTINRDVTQAFTFEDYKALYY